MYKMANKPTHQTLFFLTALYFFTFNYNLHAAEEKGAYYINKIFFNTNGKTRQNTILRTAEITKGKRFKTIYDVQDYVERKSQILKNQRIFETAYITYQENEMDVYGRIAIDLVIHTTESRNFVIFPEPHLGGTNGKTKGGVILKARDYNFLGTNSPLRIDLGYQYEPNDYNYSEHALSLGLDLNFPFTGLGFNWNFKFENAAKFFIKQSSMYRNITGMSVEIPFFTTKFNIGYNQGVALNEELSKEDKIILNNNVHQFSYLSSTGYTSWKIPTGLKFAALDELTYTPALSVTANYLKRGVDIYGTVGSTVNPSQSLGFIKIDWSENFRKGFNIMAANSNSYNINSKSWSHSISFDGQAHVIISDIIGMSFRLYGLHWFTGALTENDRAARTVSYLLRGIDDDLVGADSALIFNFDFAYLLFKFMPSEWFNNKKFRFFNFEFHLGPFVDLALVQGQQYDENSNYLTGISFTPNNLLVSTGFQAIIFPLTFRSIFLRFSMGWNLSPVMKSDIPKRNDFGSYEFSLGIGHFY
ncbi:MAG: hypothetical protein Ta2F_07610 [Termitinemataceae bacterium]|nr:MAG: hypothetical protein Ta2F_07610 [Termitinemataceae bacterium]